MGRKKDIGELGRAIKAPSFQNPDASPDLAGLDPVSPTTLVLCISEIKAYEHNPRLAENLEYPRLKDSIRAKRALTTPLTVTKRPGDELYTIAAGGNSRLKALKELADETGDDAFSHVTCRFEPWDSECRVFANHLIENDVRGHMSFGDKARAIVEWQRLYEESHPADAPLSQRDLVERLAEAGYRIHQTMISPLLTVARVLLPHLPTLFGSGLGRPSAERLVRLRNCAARYWEDHLRSSAAGAPDPMFDDLFAAACAEGDCHYADWDQDLFQSTLTVRIADALGLDHKLVALDLDSLYHGYSIQVPEPPSAALAKDPQGLTSEWAFERSREIDAIRMQRARARIGASPDAPSKAGGAEQASEDTASESSAPTRGGEDRPLDPARLREGNYLAARELATAHGLDQFVMPIDIGFGFFIEAPEPSAVAPEDKDKPIGREEGLVLSGVRSRLWWTLSLIADQLAPTHLDEIGVSYPASWLVELFTELPKRSPDKDALEMLHVLVGEPSSQAPVWDALTDPSLTERDTAALYQLIGHSRALRRRAEEGAIAIWKAAE